MCILGTPMVAFAQIAPLHLQIILHPKRQVPVITRASGLNAHCIDIVFPVIVVTCLKQLISSLKEIRIAIELLSFSIFHENLHCD